MLNVNLPKMHAGMSNRVGDALVQLSQGLSGIGIGFYYSWKLTLVFLAFSPVQIVGLAYFSASIDDFNHSMVSSRLCHFSVST